MANLGCKMSSVDTFNKQQRVNMECPDYRIQKISSELQDNLTWRHLLESN